MHVHVGLVEFLAFTAYYVILRFFVWILNLRYADRPIGSAFTWLL